MNNLTRKEPEAVQQVPTTYQAVIILLLTFLDTTWRAFVPTIGGTVLGIVLDNATGRAPLFTTALIFIGFVTSALLITLQIRRVRKSR
jgi:hypothetical protein